MKANHLVLPVLTCLWWTCIPTQPAWAAAEKLKVTEPQWEALKAGEVILLNDESDAKDPAKRYCVAAVMIDAPVKEVWNVVNDKEAAPEYVEDLKYAKVIEKNRDYVLIEQHMKLSPLLPMFKYVVKHEPQPHHRVDFSRHSGDLKHIEGSWKFFPVEENQKTVLVYRLLIDPGIPLPGFVIHNSIKSSLPNALIALRDRVYELQKK